MSRRAHTLAAGLLIIVALVAIVYELIGNPLDPFDNRRFSVEAWRSASEHRNLDWRARMCRDLINRVIRPGMSEKQVVALLGIPDRVRDTRGPGGDPLPDRHIYEYEIGSWSFQGMDDAFLYVHIDLIDHVLKTEIYGY
jgi:hypothetical protein